MGAAKLHSLPSVTRVVPLSPKHCTSTSLGCFVKLRVRGAPDARRVGWRSATRSSGLAVSTHPPLNQLRQQYEAFMVGICVPTEVTERSGGVRLHPPPSRTATRRAVMPMSDVDNLGISSTIPFHSPRSGLSP